MPAWTIRTLIIRSNDDIGFPSTLRKGGWKTTTPLSYYLATVARLRSRQFTCPRQRQRGLHDDCRVPLNTDAPGVLVLDRTDILDADTSGITTEDTVYAIVLVHANGVDRRAS